MGEIAVLSEVSTLASSLPFADKPICGIFNLPAISWSTVKTSESYGSFFECLELEEWSHYVSSPTRNQNILDLVFIEGRTPILRILVKDFQVATTTLSCVALYRNHKK